MKTAKEINDLKIKISLFDEALHEAALKGKPDERDNALANLVNTPGWGIIENFFDKMVCELLVPEPFEGDAESYAIRSQAKLIAINAFEEVVKCVKDSDSRMKAVAQGNKPQSPSEKSEPGA